VIRTYSGVRSQVHTRSARPSPGRRGGGCFLLENGARRGIAWAVAPVRGSTTRRRGHLEGQRHGERDSGRASGGEDRPVRSAAVDRVLRGPSGQCPATSCGGYSPHDVNLDDPRRRWRGRSPLAVDRLSPGGRDGEWLTSPRWRHRHAIPARAPFSSRNDRSASTWTRARERWCDCDLSGVVRINADYTS